MARKKDVIIIGAGPIGLACGIEAKKHNLDYLVIEKGTLTNSLFNYPTNMVFFSTSERLEIGGVPFISHGYKPTRSEALEYYRRVKEQWNLNVNTYEKVTEINGEDGDFEIVTSRGKYQAAKVVIAGGFFEKANMMGIKGEDLPKVTHYFKEAHPYVDQKVLVAGGGNSAVDVALECFRKGAEVTMVILKNKLEDNVKYWVRPDIENRIEEASITSYFNSKLAEIRENEVDIDTPDGIVTVENDFVLAMTGYHPDFALLEHAGVEFRQPGREPVYNEETFETSVKGLYIAGVICGGMNTHKWFIENSRYHAESIIKDITGN